jgi:hypothetical protein
MSRALSSRAIASGNAQQTSEVWLVLLTISHPDLLEPVRVVNNNENITSRGNEFIAFPFEIDLPGEDPDMPSKARLRIDNLDRRIVNIIRSITSPPSISLEVILASYPDVVEIGFEGLVMREVEYDAQAVTGDLVYESIFTEPITSTMTPSRFPGLF